MLWHHSPSYWPTMFWSVLSWIGRYLGAGLWSIHAQSTNAGSDDDVGKRCAFHVWAVLTILIVAVLRGDSAVKGIVTFEQSSEDSKTIISWEITGNDANAERGMHIHAFGDNTNGCTSAGPHFNPHNQDHGAPSDEKRHVGDLGNVRTDGQGTAKSSVQDALIKLIGPESVIGVRSGYNGRVAHG